MELTLEKRPRPAECVAISFSDEDMGDIFSPHDDALVITVGVNGFDMERVLIHTGSSVDILFVDALWEKQRRI